MLPPASPFLCCALVVAGLLCPSLGAAPQTGDPARTVTIVVPGFDPDGATLTGPFGVDVYESLLGEIGLIAGIPTIQDPGGMTAPDLVTECLYYGDLVPTYYTAQDILDLDQVTQQWGGGVPRYALIMAKFTCHVLERTGAAQANIAGGSFGGLISRYMLRHDLEGLASSGRIARWITLEGANNGSWTASNNFMVWLWSMFNVPNVDVDHLDYAWVEANLNSPHDRMSSPLYGNILVGHTSSTYDTANSGALTTILLLNGSWEVNDGVLLASSGAFTSADPVAMYRDRLPTRSWHPADHYVLSDYQGAWLTIAAFLTGDRRLTVRATGLRVNSLSEGGFFNPLPAEITLESTVRSSLGISQWGIAEAICVRDVVGGAVPVYDVSVAGQWFPIDQIVFDDLLLPGETGLELEFTIQELDWDLRFDVAEVGNNTVLGSLSTTLALTPGTFILSGSTFDLQLEVSTQEYPFGRSLWLDRVEDADEGILAASGASQVIELDFSSASAGVDYTVVGGMSGTFPGTTLSNGFFLPLNLDLYTNQMWQALNSPQYSSFVGQLDAQGRATAVLNSSASPVPSRAIGTTFTYVAVLSDASGAFQVSNPIQVEFQ